MYIFYILKCMNLDPLGTGGLSPTSIILLRGRHHQCSSNNEASFHPIIRNVNGRPPPPNNWQSKFWNHENFSSLFSLDFLGKCLRPYPPPSIFCGKFLRLYPSIFLGENFSVPIPLDFFGGRTFFATLAHVCLPIFSSPPQYFHWNFLLPKYFNWEDGVSIVPLTIMSLTGQFHL